MIDDGPPASAAPDEPPAADARDALAAEAPQDNPATAEVPTAAGQPKDAARESGSDGAPAPAANTDPSAAKRVEEFLRVVDRTAAVRGRIVAVAQQITDMPSARRLAPKWADLTYECQALVTQQASLAGQELVGPHAVRYTQAKARDDEQSQAIEAEMARIEKLVDVMPMMNAELAKRDSGEVKVDASSDTTVPKAKNRSRQPPPAALKRVPAK